MKDSLQEQIDYLLKLEEHCKKNKQKFTLRNRSKLNRLLSEQITEQLKEQVINLNNLSDEHKGTEG